ncbi:MAG: hypothetical protein ABSB26_05915 [Nitrososphaerales archaeon]
MIAGAIVGGLTSDMYTSSYGCTVRISQSLIAFIFLAVMLYSALLSETTSKSRRYTFEGFAVAVTSSLMLCEVVAQIIGNAGQALLTLSAGTAILTFTFVHDEDKSAVARDADSEGITR